ncbi:hypothetical protein ZWY2020_029117 [Hordeum vulgare]|nr:hypothetical protein ZWY2020_029117 [Hordeum vulgare]
MGANGRGEHHSPSSAKTSPRGAAGGGGGEQYSSAAKSPRAGGGGGGEHYSSSSKSPRAGIGGGVSSLLPSGAVASLLESRWAISAALTVFLFLAVTLTVTSSSSSLSPVSASFFSVLPAGRADYVEPKVQQQQQQPQAPATPPPPPPGAGVPRLAYLISGSKGDLDRLWRAARALPPAQPLRGAPGPRRRPWASGWSWRRGWPTAPCSAASATWR